MTDANLQLDLLNSLHITVGTRKGIEHARPPPSSPSCFWVLLGKSPALFSAYVQPDRQFRPNPLLFSIAEEEQKELQIGCIPTVNKTDNAEPRAASKPGSPVSLNKHLLFKMGCDYQSSQYTLVATRYKK